MAALDNIPAELKDRPQWVVWKRVARDGKPTKIPYQVNGRPASSTDPATWASFPAVLDAVKADRSLSGIGYVFSKHDPYVGVDLDNCRNKETGELSPWAQKLINEFDTYAEVSPSKTGVKLWLNGSLPTDQTGKRTNYETGQVELYQSGRYFAVTGQALKPGAPIVARPRELAGLWNRLFGKASETPTTCSTAEADKAAALAALEKLPDSISGEQGHDKMLRACCEILRHGVTGDDAWELVNWFNDHKCDPPWNESELKHKWESANAKVLRGREFGVLSNDPAVNGGGYRLGLIEYHDFLSRDFQQNYLIDGILAQGEHLVLGGPKKALKTGVTLDMMISLASGSDFLGKFPVKTPTTVAFISGESGAATLQRQARRMAAARGATIPRDKWFIGFDLPQISNADHLRELEAAIVEHNIGFLAIDPAYLATLSGAKADGASNVFAMGSVLGGFGRLTKTTGVTLALVHHTKKLGKSPYKPLDLDDLSQAGFAEWARQWLLLSRRSPYVAGRHELYLTVGGSAGHNGVWEVDINEGDEITGRQWLVDVREYDGDAAAGGSGDSLAALGDRALSALLCAPDSKLSRTALCEAISADQRKGGKGDKVIDYLERAGKVRVETAADARGRTLKTVVAIHKLF
jgi:hypothetical protein